MDVVSLWITIDIVITVIAATLGIGYLVYEGDSDCIGLYVMIGFLILIPLSNITIAIILCVLHKDETPFFEDMWNLLVKFFTQSNVLKRIGIKRIPIPLWPVAAVAPFFYLIYLLGKTLLIGLKHVFLFVAEYVFGCYRCKSCKKFRWINVSKVRDRKHGTVCEYCALANKLSR